LVRGLREEGFLVQVNAEQPFVYQALRSYEDLPGRLLGHLVQRVVRGSRAQSFCRLIDQLKLSAEERAVLVTTSLAARPSQGIPSI
jgi:hypothetical protein